jgi:reverse gyrase
MIRVGLCKSCGGPYDENEIADGYCLDCLPEGDTEVQEIVAQMRNIQDLDAE